MLAFVTVTPGVALVDGVGVEIALHPDINVRDASAANPAPIRATQRGVTSRRGVGRMPVTRAP